MSQSTGDGSSEADVWLNRINVSLARSNALINSWLPPKPAAAAQTVGDEDRDDFRSMTEVGGYGSKAAYEDERSADGASLLSRKKPGSNDKLLEQLLGKKAARAKKSQGVGGKDTSTAEHKQSKPLPKVSRQEPSKAADSDDEDEGGRATAFQSRRPKAQKPGPVEQDENVDVKQNVSVDTTGAGKESNHEDTYEADTNQRPAKRKKGSYLDEILAQRPKQKKGRKTQTNG